MKKNDEKSNEKNEENINLEKKDQNLEYIKKQIEKNKNVSTDNVEFVSFETLINEIDIKCEKYRVIYIDKEEELVYDDGEFFVCCSIDSRKKKNKITKKKASEMYIEYFIRYQLNPIIEQKKLYMQVNELKNKKVVGNKIKDTTKEVKQKEVKPKEVKPKEFKEKEIKTKEVKPKKIKTTKKIDDDLER